MVEIEEKTASTPTEIDTPTMDHQHAIEETKEQSHMEDV